MFFDASVQLLQSKLLPYIFMLSTDSAQYRECGTVTGISGDDVTIDRGDVQVTVSFSAIPDDLKALRERLESGATSISVKVRKIVSGQVVASQMELPEWGERNVE